MFKAKFPFYLGLIITGIYLIINLFTVNDYGVTWDYTYHFNAGLWHLKQNLTDPSFIMGPSPPLSDIMPVLSFKFFSEKLQLLAWDSAYNLYSVIIGSLGIGVIYFAVAEILNWKIALFSAISLAFLPRYFGHLHNNMKDIPQSVFFALSVYLFWRLFKKPAIKNMVFACLAFALSYNSKVNAVFVLVIAVFYILLNFLIRFLNHQPVRKIRPYVWLYFILAPLMALVLWWPLWDNPIGRLKEASHSYTTSTTNMPVLYFGNIYFSGNNIPWHYPLGQLAVTTPVIFLIFFVFGLSKLVFSISDKKTGSLLILLWFIVPLTRYLKPGMIVIDDVRHFMEVLFPFTIIAGIGCYSVFEYIYYIFKRVNKLSSSYAIIPILSVLYIIYLSYQIVTFHPYQTSYYNELTKGIAGAKDRFDIEFWASAYKHALNWLNTNANTSSKIIIPMAPDIAKLYLRNDLTAFLNTNNLADADNNIYLKADYVVILNRRSFFSWYNLYPYIKSRTPAYSLKLKGVSLVDIYKN